MDLFARATKTPGRATISITVKQQSPLIYIVVPKFVQHTLRKELPAQK